MKRILSFLLLLAAVHALFALDISIDNPKACDVYHVSDTVTVQVTSTVSLTAGLELYFGDSIVPFPRNVPNSRGGYTGSIKLTSGGTSTVRFLIPQTFSIKQATGTVSVISTISNQCFVRLYGTGYSPQDSMTLAVSDGYFSVVSKSSIINDAYSNTAEDGPGVRSIFCAGATVSLPQNATGCMAYSFSGRLLWKYSRAAHSTAQKVNLPLELQQFGMMILKFSYTH